MIALRCVLDGSCARARRIQAAGFAFVGTGIVFSILIVGIRYLLSSYFLIDKSPSIGRIRLKHLSGMGDFSDSLAAISQEVVLRDAALGGKADYGRASGAHC
jgi:hypothetical protein